MILKIQAKCADLCESELVDDKGKVVAKMDGYVPSFMPDGGGDYVTLEIDLKM